MRYFLFISFICTSLYGTGNLQAQSVGDLSKNLASGIAELRKDIFNRKQNYNKNLNDIVTRLDSSTLNKSLKKDIHEFIKQDIQVGGLSNSLEAYDLIPKTSPYKNIYIEQYIANNQDFQIDKDLILEMTVEKILTADAKINASQLKLLQKDFEFIDIKKNDRLFLYKAKGALYGMLLGYTYDGIDILLHNYDLSDHYTALDRADRYPNINNGNSIEFLHNGNDARLMIERDQWDKIIVRDPSFFEQSPGYILKSFHDNLTPSGYLYVNLNVSTNQGKCKDGLPEAKIIKMAMRADFKLIDKLEMGCQTYFKFQSVKE